MRPAVRTCRACGCTDLAACPGGGAWIAPDLCSACDAVVLVIYDERPREILVGPSSYVGRRPLSSYPGTQAGAKLALGHVAAFACT